MKKIDLTGQRFGMLTIISRADKPEHWNAACDCGGIKTIRWSSLRKGVGLHCSNHPRAGLGRTLKILGKKFGRLTVIGYIGNDKKRGSIWTVRCDCGVIKNLVGSQFSAPDRHTQSCGCLRDERRIESHTTHGETKDGEWSPRYYLWSNAKGRAAKKGIPFNIDLEDITIPETCPLLGIPMFSGTRESGPIRNSPTLDRIYPEKGYVKGNVWVVSYKANTMKSDATPTEVRLLAENLTRKINELDGNISQNQPGD